jgi:hypothetical protein
MGKPDYLVIDQSRFHLRATVGWPTQQTLLLEQEYNRIANATPAGT